MSKPLAPNVSPNGAVFELSESFLGQALKLLIHYVRLPIA